MLRLSLLRAATCVRTTPIQAHDFTYALLHHLGDWRQGRSSAGYDLNAALPLARGRFLAAGTLPAATHSQFAERANVVLETVKKAEDGSG